MALIIKFEGKDYPFDTQSITVDEWRELKRKYGMTPKGFDAGLREVDPDAYTFIYWLLLRQHDSRVVLGDDLKPDIIALNAAIAAAEPDEPEKPEAEADPTRDGSLPDTRTRKSPGSTTATSAPSAMSISSPSPVSAVSEPPL